MSVPDSRATCMCKPQRHASKSGSTKNLLCSCRLQVCLGAAKLAGFRQAFSHIVVVLLGTSSDPS
jgi:hypothetical protein